MYDGAYTNPNEIVPARVTLNGVRVARRNYAEPATTQNETRRRANMDLAAGRIAWICVPRDEETGKASGNGEWRGVTHAELLASLEEDVKAYHDAQEDHKREARQLAQGNKFLGIFSFGRNSSGPYKGPSFRDVPIITFKPEQLARGLELLVEKGLLRQEEIEGEVTYFVTPAFFDGLDIAPLMEEVTEP